jgi:hypothetical protein
MGPRLERRRRSGDQSAVRRVTDQRTEEVS